MKDVDLAKFQFDYDLTWAAFFINPDGTIYGRYSTRSVAGPMAHNSMESLKNAMKRALELHQNYPANKATLVGKRGAEPKWKKALDIPALRKQFAKKLMLPTSERNCIHCHNIYDGWHNTAYDEGTFNQDVLWVYPLPDNIGMSIEVDSGVIVEKVAMGTPAKKAGILAGDTIREMDGQPIISIADMQWVLHNLPQTAELQIEVERDNQMMTKTLSLSGDWKKSDISWRGSMWGLRPKFKSWTPELSTEEKDKLGLTPDAFALKVHGVHSKRLEEAGLKKGDIIIEAAGMKEQMTGPQFNVWIKLNYHEGDKLPIQVMRDGQALSLNIPLE